MKKATNHASVILKLIASQQGDVSVFDKIFFLFLLARKVCFEIVVLFWQPNHKGPLVRNVRYIFSHLVMSFTAAQNDELMKTFRYLEV